MLRLHVGFNIYWHWVPTQQASDNLPIEDYYLRTRVTFYINAEENPLKIDVGSLAALITSF